MEKQRSIRILTIIFLVIFILCLLFVIWTINTKFKFNEEPEYNLRF